MATTYKVKVNVWGNIIGRQVSILTRTSNPGTPKGVPALFALFLP